MWYKVLTNDLHSAHGGEFDWSEYVGDPNKRTPIVSRVRICDRGYHATTDPMSWPVLGMRVFEAVVDGEPVETRDVKGVWPTMGLGPERPELVPSWWHDVEEFVSELSGIPWVTPQGDPDPKWRMFEPDAVRRAVWSPLYSPIWNVGRRRARHALQNIEMHAGRDRDAALTMAEDSLFSAVLDAIAEKSVAEFVPRDFGWTAAEDAQLWARALICSDLGIDQDCVDYLRSRMDVWRRGYAVLYDERGVLCVYNPVGPRTEGRRKCPFCGGQHTYMDRDQRYAVFVSCDTCGATGPRILLAEDDDLDDAEAQAWRAWNRRAFVAAGLGLQDSRKTT